VAVEIVVRAVGIAGRVARSKSTKFPVEVTETEVVQTDGTVTFLSAELAVLGGGTGGSDLFAEGFVVGGGLATYSTDFSNNPVID
jgi:hypothetical protein